jgi:Rps23 Pro-64 3,4-dihydroxylase Tpa1-like proline 4-hydroxylase
MMLPTGNTSGDLQSRAGTDTRKFPMPGTSPPKFVVMDEFLPASLLAAIERFVASDAAMELSDIGEGGDGSYAAPRRRWVGPHGLGPLNAEFEAAVMARFPELCASTGVPPFEVARAELEVCAHRDGHFFGRHIDTVSRDERADRTTDRMISAVYYFPREPRAFTGGELTLLSFTGEAASNPIEPRRNRLVAFASMALHEVSPVVIADDSFENARFSVNCWLHRPRT